MTIAVRAGAMASVFIGVASAAENASLEAWKDEQFRRAVENRVKGWNEHVLVTVVNDITGARHLSCMTGDDLVKALDIEHAFDDFGWERANALALASKDRVFHFRNDWAWGWVEPPYTERDLATARHLIEGMDRAWIIHEIDCSLRGACASEACDWVSDDEPSGSRIPAMAHVLLERGIPTMSSTCDGGLRPARDRNAGHALVPAPPDR